MSDPLPASQSRPLEGGASFSLANRIERALFIAAWALLARWTPRPLKAWRRFLLRCFGAQLGEGAVVYPTATIWLPRNLIMGRFAVLGPGVDCYTMAPITIGDHAVISQRAFLCAGNHDPRDPHFQLVTAPVTIGAHAWVAAEAFVGPGVTVGEGAVLAARCVATRDIAPWTIHAGNPSRQIAERHMREG